MSEPLKIVQDFMMGSQGGNVEFYDSEGGLLALAQDTKYKMPRENVINNNEAMRLVNSCKSYWRISQHHESPLNYIKEKLVKWGLKDISTPYEIR